MNPTIEYLFRKSEDWLVARATHHFMNGNYSDYLFVLDNAHGMSINNFTNMFIDNYSVLNASPVPDCSSSFSGNPLIVFGAQSAGKYRSSGIDIPLFLGLLKCYRQSYLDLVSRSRLKKDHKSLVNGLVLSFFDRIELGVSASWASAIHDSSSDRDHDKGENGFHKDDISSRVLQESSSPMILLNEDNTVYRCNQPAARLLPDSATSPGIHRKRKGELNSFPWFGKELSLFRSGKQTEIRFKRKVKTKEGLNYFSVRLSRAHAKNIHHSKILIALQDIGVDNKMPDTVIFERKLFLATFENLPLGIMLFEYTGRITFVNKYFSELFGYSVKEIQNLGHFSDKTFPDPEYREKAKESLQKPLRGKISLSRPKILNITSKKGERKTVQCIVAKIKKGEYIATFEDITGQAMIKKTPGQREVKFQTLVEKSIAGVYIIQDYRFTYANQRFADIHGYTIDEIVGGMSPRDLVIPEDYHVVERYIHKRLKGEIDNARFNFRIKRKDNVIVHVEVFGSRMHADDKPAIFGTLIDISDRVKSEEMIMQMAYYDVLTGAPNRALLYDRLEMAVASAQRKKGMLAVMMLDLDRFKQVNDTYGHHIGDVLLKNVAKRIAKALRKTDTLARMGGDEFIILLPDINKIDDVMRVARKILKIFQSPFTLSSHIISITTSIGIAVYPEDADNVDNLLKHADSAMYNAKQQGRNQAYLFSREEKLLSFPRR